MTCWLSWGYRKKIVCHVCGKRQFKAKGWDRQVCKRCNAELYNGGRCPL